MAAPTPTEFKARYTEFAATDNLVVQAAIDDAAPWFDEARWGDFYTQGVCAFVAHRLKTQADATAGKAAASGPVQSKSVGDVSVSYAQSQMKPTDAFLATTLYGQLYLQLRRLVGMGAMAV